MYLLIERMICGLDINYSVSIVSDYQYGKETIKNMVDDRRWNKEEVHTSEDTEARIPYSVTHTNEDGHQGIFMIRSVVNEVSNPAVLLIHR